MTWIRDTFLWLRDRMNRLLVVIVVIPQEQSCAEAGVDVLYASGSREIEDIKAIVAALSPKPVNVLMS
jgi:2-methylisocitrate lyase-like PEP mutase family enzyme